MATVTKPLALDESINTTEQTPRNVADVLAQGLDAIEQAIAGGSGSGGHVIEDTNGTALTQREKMQFVDAGVTDDSANNKTKVEIVQTISSEADLANAPDGVYQGTWDEDPEDILTADMVGYGSGTVKDALDELNRGSVSVTANGVKTLSTLLDELFALVDMSKVGIYTKLRFPDTAAINTIFSVVQFTSSDIVLTAPYAWDSANYSVLRTFNMKSSGSQYYWSRTNGTVGNGSSNVVDNGLIITLYY